MLEILPIKILYCHKIVGSHLLCYLTILGFQNVDNYGRNQVGGFAWHIYLYFAAVYSNSILMGLKQQRLYSYKYPEESTILYKTSATANTH